MSKLPASALPFMEAAARQLARLPGPASPPGVGGCGWSGRVAEVLLAAGDLPSGPGPERAAALLAEEPVLLSVFFQNVDLLYEAAYPGRDAVSVAVMHALALLEDR